MSDAMPETTTERDAAREEILSRVWSALGPRGELSPRRPPALVPARAYTGARSELDLLLSEIGKLGGATLEISSRMRLRQALEELVKAQGIKRATMWTTVGLKELGIAEMLGDLGVRIISSHEDKHQLAECDLGVTGVDAAMPETGTLLLRASPDRPRLVSLVPRVHLAVFYEDALRVDLGQALAEVRGESLVCITGPSRTADIEMTLSLGVHGPRALYVWAVGPDCRAG